MATIQAAIALYDGVTGPLQHMTSAMNIVLSSFEAMQAACGRAMDVSAIQQAREELVQVETALDDIEGNIRQARDMQLDFNAAIRGGGTDAGGLEKKLRGVVGAFAGFLSVRSAVGWIKESLELSDVQRNTERQLAVVLKNVGGTQEAFEALKTTASSIQGYSLYGDEAMLGGAAEFATYIKDPGAIQAMMGTLADYAAGMSGGGEIDTKTMVDYATQLGKVLNGTYDGITKKGFELTDAQKEIIESGTDMEKALVVSDVIAESWDGLAEAMANTPDGQIIQFKNRWGDIREEIGDRLYPAVLRFFQTLNNNLPQAQGVMSRLADAAGMLLVVLGGLIASASAVAGFFVDNWSWIEPIIWGIVGALMAYNAVNLVANGIIAAQAFQDKLAAIDKAKKAAAASGATAATFSETAAQYGLNAALYACPLTWIILLIIALVAVFYAAVAAVNHFAGTSISATGLIAGAFMTALAFVGNLFVGLFNLMTDVFVLINNLIAEVANFIGNVFIDPVGSVARLFFGLADTVLGIRGALASAIDAVFGSDLGSSVQGWRDNLGTWVDDTFGKGQEVMERLDPNDMHLGRFEYGKAFDIGYQFGEGIEDKVGSLFRFDALDTDNFGSLMDGIYGNTGEIAGNTAASKDALEISEEDLRYLRDIAEREAINRYTTAQITVEQHNENHIDRDTDLDGIMEAWTADFAEKLDVSAEGVHV